MRLTPLVLAAALLSSLSACGNGPTTPDPGAAFNSTLGATSSARGQSRAFVAADAAIAVQMALYHVLTGFTRASAKELGKANVLSALGSVDPDSTGQYQVDLTTSTGTVKTLRKGQASVDLTFGFTRTESAHGFTYTATSVTGKVEGYDVAIGPVTLTFDRSLDASGHALVNADGTNGWTAKLAANGELSYHGEVAAHINTAGFDLAWPAPAAGSRVGSLVIDVPSQDATFHGDAFVGTDTVTTRATVTVAADARTYKLDLSGLGKVDITAIP